MAKFVELAQQMAQKAAQSKPRRESKGDRVARTLDAIGRGEPCKVVLAQGFKWGARIYHQGEIFDDYRNMPAVQGIVSEGYIMPVAESSAHEMAVIVDKFMRDVVKPAEAEYNRAASESASADAHAATTAAIASEAAATAKAKREYLKQLDAKLSKRLQAADALEVFGKD